MNRRTLISIGFALPLAIGVVAVSLALAQPARTASLSYPDLAMARLADVDIVNANGQLQLRFSATIVNVGQGPFELNATRSDASTPFSVVQKVYGSDGSAEVPVPGRRPRVGRRRAQPLARPRTSRPTSSTVSTTAPRWGRG